MLTLREKHNDGNTLWYDFSIEGVTIGQCQIKLVSHDGNSLYYEIYEEHRGQGLGKILLGEALKEMRTLGITQASILCEVNNYASNSLLTEQLGEGKIIIQYILK